MDNEHLIRVDDLSMTYRVKAGFGRRLDVKAVDGVSFFIDENETLGLVGESGCGKTTIARCLIQLNKNTGGSIRFRGADVSRLAPEAMRVLRKDMQIVFQDPYSSLDPRMRVGDIVGEPLIVHGLAKKNSAAYREKVEELLNLVGLEAYTAARFPHEFSGGQRQRIGIARALATDPAFVVLDEPVSALDVSIQDQIVSLLLELQQKLRLTYLFIAHDVSVVRNISDRVAVMYLGKIVEVLPSESLYQNALNPYTVSLMSAVPIPDPRVERSRPRVKMLGEMPSAVHPPSGCRFHPRCPNAAERCARECPELTEAEKGHWVACFNLAR